LQKNSRFLLIYFFPTLLKFTRNFLLLTHKSTYSIHLPIRKDVQKVKKKFQIIRVVIAFYKFVIMHQILYIFYVLFGFWENIRTNKVPIFKFVLYILQKTFLFYICLRIFSKYFFLWCQYYPYCMMYNLVQIQIIFNTCVSCFSDLKILYSYI